MKSRHSFSVLFYVRSDREGFGRAPLYIKITVEGKKVYLPTKQSVEVSQCNQKAQKLKGNSTENSSARDRIRQITNEINVAYDELPFQKEVVTAEKLKVDEISFHESATHDQVEL